MLYNTWTNVIIILNKLIQVVNQNPSFTDIGTTKVHIGKLSFTWHFLLLSQYMPKYDYASVESDQPLPIHLCCFLAILFMFIVFWCIITYDHVLYSMFHNLKLIVMECPSLLVLDLHRLSNHFAGSFHLWCHCKRKTPFTELEELLGVSTYLRLVFFIFHNRQPFLLPWTHVSSYEQ